MVIYHHNDLDGRCAAAIALRKYPYARTIEVNYGDNPDFKQDWFSNRAEMMPCHVMILDFSFKPEKMAELFYLTPKNCVVWIDHHKTAKEYDYDLPGARDFSTPGLSGCELTWQHLFPNEAMPEAVRLLGDYDTWRFDTKDASMQFQFGMRSEHTKPQSVLWRNVFEDIDLVKTIQDTGKVILEYKDSVFKSILKNGYKTVWEGWMCFVINTPMIDSDMFKDHEQYLCISWIYTGKNYIVSLRSRAPEVCDVSVIAKKHGGGGHQGAAGFICDALPFRPGSD